MKSVAALLRSLYNKPALVTEEYAASVVDALTNKELAMFEVGKGENGQPESHQEGKALVIEIEGGLTYKPYGMCPRLNSYTAMVNMARTVAASPEYTKMVIMADSPGGMAYQCFESALLAKRILNDAGKELITYVDGCACSAMYAWSVVSDEIVANPMATVGSIGVVVAIKNTLPKEIKDGNEVLFITAGENKVPFDKEGYLKKEKLEKIQEEVTLLGDKFISHVVSHRDITEEAVRGMKAESFSANEALEKGLIDKVMEKDEFFSYLSDLLEKENKENTRLEDNVPTMSEYETLEAKLADLEKANASLAADNATLASFVKKAADKEKAETHAKLVAKLDGYSFVEDATALATTLEGYEDADAVLSAFDKASEMLSAKDAQAESEESDLFEQQSLQTEDDLDIDTTSNVIEMAQSELVNRYQKGEAK